MNTYIPPLLISKSRHFSVLSIYFLGNPCKTVCVCIYKLDEKNDSILYYTHTGWIRVCTQNKIFRIQNTIHNTKKERKKKEENKRATAMRENEN